MRGEIEGGRDAEVGVKESILLYRRTPIGKGEGAVVQCHLVIHLGVVKTQHQPCAQRPLVAQIEVGDDRYTGSYSSLIGVWACQCLRRKFAEPIAHQQACANLIAPRTLVILKYHNMLCRVLQSPRLAGVGG